MTNVANCTSLTKSGFIILGLSLDLKSNVV